MAVKRIPRMVPGEPLTPMESDYYNQMVDQMNAIANLQAGPGLDWEMSRNIAKLDVDAQGVVQQLFPFAVSQSGPSSIRIRYGTVNGLEPTIDDVPISQGPTIDLGGLGGNVGVFLEGQVDTASGNTFGELLGVTVVANNIQLPASFERPRKRIATVQMKLAFGPGGATSVVHKIYQETFSSFSLVRWYENIVWQGGFG